MDSLPLEIHDEFISKYLHYDDCLALRNTNKNIKAIYSTKKIAINCIKNTIGKAERDGLDMCDYISKMKIHDKEIGIVISHLSKYSLSEIMYRSSYYGNIKMIDYILRCSNNTLDIYESGLYGSCEGNNRLLIFYFLDTIIKKMDFDIKLTKRHISCFDINPFTKNQNPAYFFIQRFIANEDIESARITTELYYCENGQNLQFQNVMEKIKSQNRYLKDIYTMCIKKTELMDVVVEMKLKAEKIGFYILDDDNVVDYIITYGSPQKINFVKNNTKNMSALQYYLNTHTN